LWLKGPTSPTEIRERAKEDPDFRERLLEFITQVASETLPDRPPASVEEDFQPGSRSFQPLLDPDLPYFESQMEIDVHDIVTKKNMHNLKHTPTCFKYGRKRCRARFPRKLVPCTQMDPETGVISIQRDHEWLNGYNKWFSLMTHANHDCQFLFTKDHAIAIIYYILKYITKPEATLHTKLTVAAAVRDAMQNLSANYMSDVDITKRFLLKTYNKLDTQREVGVPEAISHLLSVPDHYTEAKFERLHTSHLLQYIKQFSQTEEKDQSSDQEQDEMLDSQLIVSNKTYVAVSYFDDYAHRGSQLKELCLYDYCSLVYKSKARGGVSFASQHPQHKSHRQFIRQDTCVIPNLLGHLLFISKNSKDIEKQEQYYCLISWIFIPWSYGSPHTMLQYQSWREFYDTNKETLSPRLLQHIDNLDLLHKSKEESQIDVLQQKVRSDEDTMNGWVDEDGISGDAIAEGFGDDEDDCENNAQTECNAIIEDIVSSSITSTDWYVLEAADANSHAGYFTSPSHGILTADNDFHYCSMSLYEMKQSVEMWKLQMAVLEKERYIGQSARQPSVFFTSGAEIDAAIDTVVQKFTLNKEQTRALKIVAYHSLGHSKVGSQLLMGIFGEGGTGKSRVIDAICDWFNLINQKQRLIITATTGAAAVKINGSTLHSAVGIPVETGDKEREIKVARVTDKQQLRWKELDYLIVDEVSMMDAKVMMQLNKTLNLLRGSNKEHEVKPFGGVNMLFYGDFYQLPAVSKLDLWRTKLGRWRQGHDLWRSLNAVVMLTQQMRQAEDPRYAEAMGRVRIHKPSDEDIAMLNSRIGVSIPDSSLAPIIVRRHHVRHALNLQKLQETAASHNISIVHCKADVIANHGLSLHQIYSVIQGPKKTLADAVLSVVPNAPLMITKNLNHLPVPLVNGAIVEFYGFSGSTNGEMDSTIVDLPEYMLVRLCPKPGDPAVQISGLPLNVVPIYPESFKYNEGHGRWARLRQFPATLAYAITDFKCQSQTYEWLRVDIKKPHVGAASVMSPYVQLSRGQSLQKLSILRPFDSDDLRAPIPEELKAEIKWEQEMSEKTVQIYS
jgi:ABC-type dipeptide/oligopeptide/nickel transport system ATPase component